MDLDPESATAGGEKLGDLGPAPKKCKVADVGKYQEAAEPVKPEAAEHRGRAAAAASGSPPVTNTPPLTLPPFPTSGKRSDIRKWERERRRIIELDTSEDIREDLPTVRTATDKYTADVLANPRDKAMVRCAALSVVGVSVTDQVRTDTKHCTGILGNWLQEEGACSVTVLTCAGIVCRLGKLCDPKPKLVIRLPNKTVLEGELLFFNIHYEIALLKISTEMPSSGSFIESSQNYLSQKISSPNYGDEVFVLARGENGSLMARQGDILWTENPDFLGCSHYMFLSCQLPQGGMGGPVIGCDGLLKGMAFRAFSPIISISTIRRCTQMWTQYRRIARPVLGLSLRTIELLEVSLQEEIFFDYDISSGYIVHDVSNGSSAQSLGITRGDIIISLDGIGAHTLPQLEDFLLGLGLEFLQAEKRIDSEVIAIEIEVYDPIRRNRRKITLPVGVSDSSELVD